MIFWALHNSTKVWQFANICKKVERITNLSAHADYNEILAWLSELSTAPKTTFITHGEPVAADMMRRHVEERLNWKVAVPEYLDCVELN